MINKIPKNTLIVIADGETAKLFKNISNDGIKIESAGNMELDYLEDKAHLVFLEIERRNKRT